MNVRLCRLALILAAVSAVAAAQGIQGTVTNGTSGKPAAGAEVTLLSLGQGMQETAHTRTDSAGRFHINFADDGMPHLVRVTHQDVNYFRMAPPGTTSVQVQIYDAARKLDGISTTAQVLRLQSNGNGLQAAQIFAVQNSSQPPRSLGGEHTYELALPEGAVIDEAGARAPGGQPIQSMPDPVPGKKDHYAFSFPLRPGETQFQVIYHLPYNGSRVVIKAPVLQDAQHFVAVLPLSMQLNAQGAAFSPMAEDKTANVQIARNVHAGDTIALTVSGTGTIADDNGGGPSQDSGNSAQQAQGGGGSMPGGPGGGLGRPIDSPDPISRYRWPLLGILAAVLVGGGFYVVRHRPVNELAGTPVTLPEAPEGPSVWAKEPDPRRTAAPSQAAPSLLLQALKDELFQLEIDRQQKRISEEEYREAKAALDVTLRRAMSRVS